VEFGKTLANSLDFYKLLVHLPTVFELPKIVVPSKLRKLVVGVPVFSVVSAPTCTIPASAFRPVAVIIVFASLSSDVPLQ
jgi:hypothetical protein